MTLYIYICWLIRILLLGDESDDLEEIESENGVEESNEEAEAEEDEDDEEESEADDEEEEEILNRDYEFEKPGVKSGSTGVVALLKGNELYVGNVGDSRCVVCREGELSL